MRTAIHLVVRAGLVALLLTVPGGAATAMAIVDSSLTISNLTITPASGSTSFPPSLTTSATTHAFNSLGEDVSDGNSGSGTDVSANALVTFAQGHATALASNNSVSASASVNIPNGTVLAGVNVPGSDSDLSGLFDITGASTNPVDVTFSMQVSGSLHGVSDIAGFLQNGDLTAELDIDGTSVLFDFETLPGLPSLAGINNYPSTTIPVSETLTATISLDPTVSHFFDMHADAEAQAFNIAEPGSLSLLLAGLGALAWRRRVGAVRPTGKKKAGRHS
jgi:PEP-CTERM motif